MTDDSFQRLREMAREICEHGSADDRALLATLLERLRADADELASRARELAELERVYRLPS